MIGVFTFGCGHTCYCRRPLGNHYTEIEGDTPADARARMELAWGMRWSMQYASREEAGVERFNLERVVTCFPWSCAGCPCGNLVQLRPYQPDAPTKPGFWWLLDDAGVEQIVDVVELEKRSASHILNAHSFEADELVAFFPGEGNGWRRLGDCRAVGWAGPLPKPRRP